MNSDTRKQRSGFSWGKGLTIAIILFVCATLGVVTYIISLDYHMVSNHHYEEAVNYQKHINRVEESRALKEPVTVTFNQNHSLITIQFPSSINLRTLTGTVELYRPSNATLDKKYDLFLNDEGIQRISTSTLTGGKWVVKINWTSAGTAYYKQESIFI